MQAWLTGSDEHDVVGSAVRCPHLRIDGDLRQSRSHSGSYDQWLPGEWRHGLVHQRMFFQEIQRDFGQRVGVVDASTGPRFRYFGVRHGQPIRIHRLLLFERPIESRFDVLQTKGTNCRPADAVPVSGKNGVT